MYSAIGRASIPPERLLKSMLLIALYTVRSERQFCEQLDFSFAGSSTWTWRHRAST
jgi:transposase